MLISRKRFFRAVNGATQNGITAGQAIGRAHRSAESALLKKELDLRTHERDEALDTLAEARVLLKQITDNLSAISLASGTEPETLKRLNELLEAISGE